jgi:hypothetical protein
MEALSSSETSVFTRATRRNIPEDAGLYIQEVFIRVTMKNAVFWDLTPRGFCKN